MLNLKIFWVSSQNERDQLAHAAKGTYFTIAFFKFDIQVGKQVDRYPLSKCKWSWWSALSSGVTTFEKCWQPFKAAFLIKRPLLLFLYQSFFTDTPFIEEICTAVPKLCSLIIFVLRILRQLYEPTCAMLFAFNSSNQFAKSTAVLQLRVTGPDRVVLGNLSMRTAVFIKQVTSLM